MPSKPSNQSNETLSGMKITCPHCGAVNQDVRPQDACWQCRKTLSSKSEVDAATSGESTEGGGLRMRNRPARLSLEERVAARKAERKTTFPRQLVIAVVLLILIALAVVYFIRHR